MCSVQEASIQLQPGHVSQWTKVKLLSHQYQNLYQRTLSSPANFKGVL